MSDVNNSEMQDDFFSDSDLINQETGEAENLIEEKTTQNAKIEGQGEKKVEGNENGEIVPEQGNVDPFEKKFFKEDGSYDAGTALDFINSNYGKYGNVNDVTSMSMIPQQVVQQQMQQQQQKEPWEIEYEKRTGYQNEQLEKAMSYHKYMEEAAQKGLQGQQILDYAGSKVKEDVLRDVERWSYKTQHERTVAEQKARAEKEAHLEFMPKSRSNLASAYEKLGGIEKFNDLIYGKKVKTVVNGKEVISMNGYGVSAINLAYDLQNGGKDIPSDPKEASDHFQRWWTKFTSNPDNLQFVINSALSQLQLAHMKHLVSSARNAGQKHATMVSKGQKPPLSKVDKRQQLQSGVQGNTDDPLGLMNTPDFIG